MSDTVKEKVQDVGNVLTLGILPASSATRRKMSPKEAPQEKIPAMPMPNDAAAKAAKRKSIAAQVARKGRASTILTQNETLG